MFCCNTRLSRMRPSQKSTVWRFRFQKTSPTRFEAKLYGSLPLLIFPWPLLFLLVYELVLQRQVGRLLRISTKFVQHHDLRAKTLFSQACLDICKYELYNQVSQKAQQRRKEMQLWVVRGRSQALAKSGANNLALLLL